VCSGVVLGEEVSGVGNRVSVGNTMVDTQLLLETFLNMSLGSVCFIDESSFLVEVKTYGLGTTLLK
jgi:hypothetical protein